MIQSINSIAMLKCQFRLSYFDSMSISICQQTVWYRKTLCHYHLPITYMYIVVPCSWLVHNVKVVVFHLNCQDLICNMMVGLDLVYLEVLIVHICKFCAPIPRWEYLRICLLGPWTPKVLINGKSLIFEKNPMMIQGIQEFREVSPALISNLNVHKRIGLSHVQCTILTYSLWRHSSVNLKKCVYEKIMKNLSRTVYEIYQRLAKPMYPWRDLELWPFNFYNINVWS